MRIHSLIAVLAIISALSGTTYAGQIIQFGTEEVGSGPPTPTAASVAALNPGLGVTGIDVTRGPGLTPVSASFAINSSGWNNPSSIDTTTAYYRFGFTTTIPYDVTSMTLGLRSSGTGPGFVDLLYSKDGGAFQMLGSPIELVGTTFNNFVANLTPIGTVDSSLVFKLIGDPTLTTNAQNNETPPVSPSTISAAGTFRFASFQDTTGAFLDPVITGQAVPEPASAILFGLGVSAVLGGAAVSRRRASAALRRRVDETYPYGSGSGQSNNVTPRLMGASAKGSDLVSVCLVPDPFHRQFEAHKIKEGFGRYGEWNAWPT
jgi:hypothetical protein